MPGARFAPSLRRAPNVEQPGRIAPAAGGPAMGKGMTLLRTTLPAALLPACIVLAAADPAVAEPVDGFYVGAGAGYNLLQDVTASVDALPGRPVGGAAGV